MGTRLNVSPMAATGGPTAATQQAFFGGPTRTILRGMRIAWLLALGLTAGGCAKSVEDWRHDLRARDPFVRLMAAVALGRSDQPEAAYDLLPALSDVSEPVRTAALEGLRTLGRKAVPALLARLELGAAPPDAMAGQTRLVASVLVDQGLSSMAPLVLALGDPRYDREAIIAALGESGPAAVGPLSELLLQPQASVAAAAATALGSLGSKAEPAVTKLVLALRRTEPDVIAATAAALGRIGPDRSDVLPALLAQARAPDGDPGLPDDAQRRSARDAARQAAVRGLLLRMASHEPALQEQALAQMADLGRTAVEGLIQALKFEDEPVAQEAAACLATLGPELLPHVIESLGERNPTHIARGALVVSRMGAPALAPLLAIINDPSHHDRVRATTAIVGLGPGADAAWPALLALLDEPQPQLPIAAALTLGQLLPPDEASLAALIAAQARASAMVSRLLLPAAVAGLLVLKGGEADEPARLAALRKLGPDAVTELGRLRNGTDPELAAAAGRALAALSAP